jgi:outer membrane protein OmpA-like peptidoglycan-associated protein
MTKLEKAEKELKIENERLRKIIQLEQQFKPLEESNLFRYLPECRKFVVRQLEGEIFEPDRDEIKPEYIHPALTAGVEIEKFLNQLTKENPDFSYLLVIEGNVANTYDMRYSKDDPNGYLLSYRRALALYDLWRRNGINFRLGNVEVLLCGSGFNGLCRDKIEENNKRFSIQIIPKVENRKTEAGETTINNW